MADRRRQVILLIGSRFDGLYLPAGALRTDSGFAPGVLEPCPDCGATGRVRDRFGRSSTCSRCGGRGRLAFDAMDALHVPVGSAATVSSARPRKTVKCDACGGDGAHGNGQRCDVCGGTGRRELHVFDLAIDTRDQAERDPLTAAIEARNQAGSYRELERALSMLAETGPAGRRSRRLLDEVFLPPAHRDLEQLTAGEGATVEAGLRFVVVRMPDPIRVPAALVLNAKELAEHRRRVKGRGVAAAALAKRDGEIRKAVRHGAPVQRVAFDYGLSVSQVNRVVNGEAA